MWRSHWTLFIYFRVLSFSIQLLIQQLRRQKMKHVAWVKNQSTVHYYENRYFSCYSCISIHNSFLFIFWRRHDFIFFVRRWWLIHQNNIRLGSSVVWSLERNQWRLRGFFFGQPGEMFFWSKRCLNILLLTLHQATRWLWLLFNVSPLILWSLFPFFYSASLTKPVLEKEIVYSCNHIVI